jgi:hypothetical protein
MTTTLHDAHTGNHKIMHPPATRIRRETTATGNGASEELLGTLMKEAGVRDRLVVATKFTVASRPGDFVCMLGDSSERRCNGQ